MSEENLATLKFLAMQLVQFADFADQNSDDDRCCVLYGLTRDCGYRILSEVQKAKKQYSAKVTSEDSDRSGREERVRV